MHKYPTPRFLFDRRKVSNKKEPGTIEIEILYQRKRKYISTGVKVLPSEWKGNKIAGNDDAINLNLKINSLKDSITKYINTLIIDNVEFTWEGLNNYLNTKSDSGNFIDFVTAMIETKTNLSKRTRDQHKKLITALNSFKRIKTFKDLIPANIDAYDKWLHEKGYKQATIGSYHKFLKIYIHDAMRLELISKNPYTGFKVDHGKQGIRKYLTEEELHKIETVKITNPMFEKIRDIFIFQTYTGLAYVDLKKFDFSKVIEKDGKYILHDVRQKSGEDYYIVLLSKALDILKKYDFKLPLISLEQYNLRLKIVAGEAKINKNLTSHMARHTYASLVLNQGIPIEVLAKMMGHSDIRTTQVYAKMFNKTVESAFDKLEEKLKNERENNN